MKKLMMLIVGATMVTVAHSATVTWASGSLIKGPSDAYMAAGDIKMYVFEFANEAAYNAADISKLDVSTAKLSGATTKSTTGISLVDDTTYGANDTIYSAVLFKANDSGVDYYMGAKLTATVDELGSGVGFTSLKNKVGSWTQAGGGGEGGVPEPTSALLLVLGGAVLARRGEQK